MVYLGDHRALTRTVFGHKIYVDTRDISLTPHLLLDGCWEMWITDVFRSLVKPGMVVLDVGANVGYYTLLAAEAVGNAGRVVAFEANPDIFSLLVRSVEINGFLDRTQCVNLGVMDRACELVFRKVANHQGSSSFEIDDATLATFHDSATDTLLRCVSIDEWCAGRLDRVDVVKIDAEGAEPRIIAGARRTLERNQDVLVLMEWSPRNRPAVESLWDLGFDGWLITHESALEALTSDDLDRETGLEMLLFSRRAVGFALA